jgi:hypothetical protein
METREITISEIEYKFLLSQNAELIKQNRAMQRLLNGKSRCGITIKKSLGESILEKYTGVQNND